MLNRSSLIAIPALASLAGCAGSSEDYPTLAIRSTELASGAAVSPEAEPYQRASPAPQTLDRAAAAAQQARAAHGDFLAAVPGVQGAVDNAVGSPAGSERWSRAQVLVAQLQAHRSLAMVALADLDRIFIESANGGESLDDIAATRGEIETLLASEDHLLQRLLASLAR